MSQNATSCPNTAGATFRTNVNNAFDTVVTLNSGTAAPGTTSAGMLWYDTTNAVVKQRNATNTGWITRWTVANAEGTLSTSLLFTADNTYDIGASGATRPRDFFLGRNATIGGTLAVTGQSTLNGTSETTAKLLGTTTGSNYTQLQFANRSDTKVWNLNFRTSNDFMVEYYNGTVWTGYVVATSDGFLKASNSGTFDGSTSYHEWRTNSSGQFIGVISSSHASNPLGIYLKYPSAAPNDTSHQFWQAVDSGATRAEVRSNGGLANFSANNVNLSDRRVKPQFETYTDTLLDDLEERFLKIERGRFKYADQTHNDWNYGKSAQSVQAVLPELVDIWNPMREVRDEETGELRHEPTPEAEQLLAEHSHDITQIGEAILARLVRRVRKLEATVYH
jgi:hypothetical protein